jgi:hypothetical protein
MKYAVETGLRYHDIQSFIKTGSGIRKLIEEIYKHTDSMVIE